MRRRARRVTIAVALAGAASLGVLVALNGATVMDHAQAWYFVMTTNTRTVYPGSDDDDPSSGNEPIFQVLADCLEGPVTYDPAADRTLGWRILEQRFPRSAYIVLRE